jgi:hypothetical protein
MSGAWQRRGGSEKPAIPIFVKIGITDTVEMMAANPPRFFENCDIIRIS